MIKLESHLKGSAADPSSLDMELINAEQERRDEQLCIVGMKIYRKLHRMPPNSSHKSIARQQWFGILNHVAAAAGVHCAKADELNIGLSNDSEDTELSRMS